MQRRTILALSSFFMLPAVGLPSHTAWADAGARAFVKSKHRELNKAMRRSKDPKTDPVLLRIFDTMLNYDYLTKETLHKHYGQLTEAQRAEFGAALKQLVQRSYRKNVRDTSGYRIDYTGDAKTKDGTGILVQTLATNPNDKREKPLEVAYAVGKLGAEWRVQDIVMGGVSLVRNYRSQFNKLIKRKGFAGLMEMMNKKLAKD